MLVIRLSGVCLPFALLTGCLNYSGRIEPSEVRVSRGGRCLIERVPELQFNESVSFLATAENESPPYFVLKAAYRPEQKPTYYDLRSLKRVPAPSPAPALERLQIFDNALPFPMRETYREWRQELLLFLKREKFKLASENIMNVNWMGNRTHVAINSVAPSVIDSLDLTGHVFGNRWPKQGRWHVEVFSVPGYRRQLYVHGPLNGKESIRWMLRWVHSSHLAILFPSSDRHVLCLCSVGK